MLARAATHLDVFKVDTSKRRFKCADNVRQLGEGGGAACMPSCERGVVPWKPHATACHSACAGHSPTHLVGIPLIYFDVKAVHSRKALEENCLAFLCSARRDKAVGRRTLLASNSA